MAKAYRITITARHMGSIRTDVSFEERGSRILQRRTSAVNGYVSEVSQSEKFLLLNENCTEEPFVFTLANISRNTNLILMNLFLFDFLTSPNEPTPGKREPMNNNALAPGGKRSSFPFRRSPLYAV
ncbi:Hypothetical protein CINCED_3A022915 [Cinara cedri]|uniref:Uncharacterized protein n=1 Tax=Cinara cedri TaxID=506608 RepID=A0A5E4M996_9HEMI|nr:Hypothetical protein CINCED_3A022915 [Cinara cedri]